MPGVAVREDRQEVPQSGREEGGELLFGEKLEEGGLAVVEGAAEGGNEFHFDGVCW